MIQTKENQFYTVEQVANNLQVHWQTVLDFIRTGQLEAVKLGKGYRISVEAFNKFIQERKTNITLMSLASSEEFLSIPRSGKHKRYKSLLIVPSEGELLIPNNYDTDNAVREIVRNEIGYFDPKPTVDGLIDDRILSHDQREMYFRSLSTGVLFFRSSLTEPEGEVHIRHLLSFSFHFIKIAFHIFDKFSYSGKALMKFRIENIKDNILKTGSFVRDLSMVDKALTEKIEIDEGPIKIARDTVADLAVNLVMRINRGFGNNRVGTEVLKNFLQNIIEGKE